jgi:hypothetical protein
MISYVPLHFKEHADDDLCVPSMRQSYPHIMVPLLLRGGEGYGGADRPGLHKMKRDQAGNSSAPPNTGTVTLRPTTTTPLDKKVPVTGGGASTIPASVFNLVNNVAGAGLLTLAAGKASSNVGWIPAILIASYLAALSAHTFTLIGRACEITGESNFPVSIELSHFLTLGSILQEVFLLNTYSLLLDFFFFFKKRDYGQQHLGQNHPLLFHS